MVHEDLMTMAMTTAIAMAMAMAMAMGYACRLMFLLELTAADCRNNKCPKPAIRTKPAKPAVPFDYNKGSGEKRTVAWKNGP
jgi:hypothetical protein